MGPPGLDKQALAAQHEELRCLVLAPQTPLVQPRGLGPVLQQWLPAWLQVGARWTPQPLPQPCEDAPPPPVAGVPFLASHHPPRSRYAVSGERIVPRIGVYSSRTS
jgi:hypothetical protein